MNNSHYGSHDVSIEGLSICILEAKQNLYQKHPPLLASFLTKISVWNSKVGFMLYHINHKNFIHQSRIYVRWYL